MSEIVNGASINKTHANVKRSRSKFFLKQRIMDTYRFGEYHPHFVFDGVSSDKYIMRSIHNARSYTLKAPLMQDIQMHKDYFYIPLRAILPFQAERIVTNPTLGDDVPSDAYTYVSDFTNKIKSISDAFIASLKASSLSSDQDYRDFLCLYLQWVVFLESIYSNGSLIASLGCNLTDILRFRSTGSAYGSFPSDLNIDDFFDKVIGGLVVDLGTSSSLAVVIDNTFYYVVPSLVGHENNQSYISVREFIARIRDTSDWKFNVGFNIPSAVKTRLGKVFNDLTGLYLTTVWTIDSNFGLDLARLWAYHLCQAEFYTNDKVDYIHLQKLTQYTA